MIVDPKAPVVPVDATTPVAFTKKITDPTKTPVDPDPKEDATTIDVGLIKHETARVVEHHSKDKFA